MFTKWRTAQNVLLADQIDSVAWFMETSICEFADVCDSFEEMHLQIGATLQSNMVFHLPRQVEIFLRPVPLGNETHMQRDYGSAKGQILTTSFGFEDPITGSVEALETHVAALVPRNFLRPPTLLSKSDYSQET